MSKILLVEDNEHVRYSIKRLLTSAGHEVIEAENGIAGIREYRQSTPELIITDIVMPDQDGLGFLSDIRTHNKSIPILAMSGGGDVVGMDYLIYAQAIDANAIIAKPFNNSVLLEKVSLLLAS